MSPTVRSVLAIAAISAAWGLALAYGLLYLVFADCFEPGCRAARNGDAEGFLWLVAIGYGLSLLAYFRARVRGVKGD